jgi:hypothetical protein
VRYRFLISGGEGMSSKVRRTDPQLWERVKRDLTHSDKGGKPDQWSARKAQLAVQEYKRRGGGYRGRKPKDTSLEQWTEEEWGTKSGRKSLESGERYLPKRARKDLSDEEYRATSDKKRCDLERGRQYSRQPKRIAEKTARHRHGATGGKRREPTKADLYEEAKRRNLPDEQSRSREGAKAMIEGDNSMTESERKDVRTDFRQAVNMAPQELERWLDSEQSQSVGWTQEGDDEAVGHKSSRRIAQLKRKKVAELSDNDYAHMRKVVGYVHRQRRSARTATSRRRAGGSRS